MTRLGRGTIESDTRKQRALLGSAPRKTVLLTDITGGSRGDIIRREASNYAAYSAKTAGQVLIGDGTDVISAALSGDVNTITGAGVVTISKTSNAQGTVSTIITGDANGAIRLAYLGVGVGSSGTDGTITLPDAGWAGNSATTARLTFDSSGATDYAYFSGARVGINETSPGGQHHVVSSAPTVVAGIYEAASGQSADLLQIRSNGAVTGDLAKIVNDGAFSTGGAEDVAALVQLSSVPSTNTTGRRFAALVRPTIDYVANNGDAHYGFFGGIRITTNSNLTSGSVGQNAIFGDVRVEGGGTYTRTHSLYARAVFTGAGATGTITTHSGLRIIDAGDESGANGAITTQNGIEIDELAYATTNYAINSKGTNTPSYHAGDWVFGADVKIGGSAGDNPASALEVLTTSAKVGQIIEAASGQTANLFEINSNGGSGGDLFKVSAAGYGYLSSGIGVGTSPAATIGIYNTAEKTTTSSTNYGTLNTLFYSPTASFSAAQYANYNQLVLTTAQTQTGGSLIGVRNRVAVSGGINAGLSAIYGSYIDVDVEDATVASAYSARLTMADVDNGSIVNSYGVSILPPTIGAGSVTNQYGIYINSLTQAVNNYSIYSAGGQAYHAGDWVFGADVKIGGSAGDNPASALEFADAKDITVGTTTGTKIGTATSQKLGFFNATPVVQRPKASYNNWAALSDVVSALVDLGLFDAT